MKVILMIVAVIFGLIFIGSLMPDAINDVITEPYSENFETVTGAGETSAIETLSYANYFADLTDMSVTSDNEDDSPAITDYDETDYDTTVSGLNANDSRILTITYAREDFTEFTGFAQFIRLLPFILIIALVGLCLWGLYSSWQHRRRGFE